MAHTTSISNPNPKGVVGSFGDVRRGVSSWRMHRRLARHAALVAALCVIAHSWSGSSQAPPNVRNEPVPPLPAAHESRQIEGWRVRIDQRLVQNETNQQSVGARALRLLTARLVGIEAGVSEEAVAKLRRFPIQIDLTHGHLRNMQYHPSAEWLTNNGYSAALEKWVHIPDAQYFLSPFENHRQPSAVLHELSHAFHDQVLGFDEPRIRAAWRKFRDSGRYQSVLTTPGGAREHYALTDAKEFFAEMSETYLAMNDFFPFVAGELQHEEPEIFQLMRDIWGPLPGRSPRKNGAEQR